MKYIMPLCYITIIFDLFINYLYIKANYLSLKIAKKVVIRIVIYPIIIKYVKYNEHYWKTVLFYQLNLSPKADYSQGKGSPQR
jgi:hypothetical protein